MEGIEKLTCKLSPTNILDKVTLEYQYTCSMMENTTHMCLLFFFCFCFLFFHIYTSAHAMNANKEALKMRSQMDRHNLKC